MQSKSALVRTLPKSYQIYDKPERPMNWAMALEQLSHYIRALKQTGLQVTEVPADENLYDCVFIEDTAILWGKKALITRMLSDREGEQSLVRDYLKETHKIIELKNAESFVEGGDVLHVKDKTFVGLSKRTNEAGIQELKDFLTEFDREVIPVPVEKCLHLKTAATYLGNDTLLVAPRLIDPQVFGPLKIIETAEGEDGAPNCIRIGNHLLASGQFPNTLTKLHVFCDANGVNLIPINTSEFEKGEGSLTCLSIIW